MAKTYLKLWSLNPDLYRTISETEALKGYIEYLQDFIASIEQDDLDVDDYKSFEEWLGTEI